MIHLKHDISPNHIGLIAGTFLGFLHLVWSALVFLKVAQSLQDWVLGLHFMNNPFHIQPFNMTTALTLVIMTTVVGYIVGFVFALFWNSVRKNFK